MLRSVRMLMPSAMAAWVRLPAVCLSAARIASFSKASRRSTWPLGSVSDGPVATLAAAASLVTLNANAAVDIFAKIGDIKGEATDDKHKGEIEVLNWGWSIQGGPRKRACASDLHITKFVDAASPNLVQGMANGTVHATALLTQRRSSQMLEHLRIELTGASVVSVQPGASSGGEGIEHVALNDAKLPDGSAEPAGEGTVSGAAERSGNRLGHVEERMAGAAGHVQHLARDGRGGHRQHVRLHHVVDVGEVARLLAVAVHLERLAAERLLEEARDHGRVLRGRPLREPGGVEIRLRRT